MIKIKKCRRTRGGRKEPLTFKRKTYPGSSDEWVTGREFYHQKWTLMIFSSSWNFPELDWLFVREAVFSFFANCGEGEKTEAGNWKQLYQTAGGIWNTSPILVNVVPGIFQSVLFGLWDKIGKGAWPHMVREACLCICGRSLEAGSCFCPFDHYSEIQKHWISCLKGDNENVILVMKRWVIINQSLASWTENSKGCRLRHVPCYLMWRASFPMVPWITGGLHLSPLLGSSAVICSWLC